MPTWRDFQTARRIRTKDFYGRNPGLRQVRYLLVGLLFVPIMATASLLGYGDVFGIPIGYARYQAALWVILLSSLAAVVIIVILAHARWKEESRLTEAFVAVGFLAIPFAWVFVAGCTLDIVTDAPACSLWAADLLFITMGWALGWSVAGPFADFLRAR